MISDKYKDIGNAKYAYYEMCWIRAIAIKVLRHAEENTDNEMLLLLSQPQLQSLATERPGVRSGV